MTVISIEINKNDGNIVWNEHEWQKCAKEVTETTLILLEGNKNEKNIIKNEHKLSKYW